MKGGHPAAQPSMIEDRGLRGARVLERVIDGERRGTLKGHRKPAVSFLSHLTATAFRATQS